MHPPLLLILLFCPLIFSAAVSLGTREDYHEKTHEMDPLRCEPHYSEREPEPLDDKRLEAAHQSLKKCISEVALVNPKVAKVEHQLAQRLFETFKFSAIEMRICWKKLKAKPVSACMRTMGMRPGDYYCNDTWGKDGCMIEVYKETCGEEVVNKIKDASTFHSAKLKKCVDQYFP